MNVLEDWTTVIKMLNVLTRLEAIYADVTMVIMEMAFIVMVCNRFLGF